MISVLSLASNGSILSMSQTDDGLEYEDAADQAEWMDIDGGGAYEGDNFFTLKQTPRLRHLIEPLFVYV